LLGFTKAPFVSAFGAYKKLQIIISFNFHLLLNFKLQMENKKTVRGALIGKDHFNVTIKPNVDYAFIVALVVILDELPAQFQIGK
jgi:uncharacterized protein YxjI